MIIEERISAYVSLVQKEIVQTLADMVSIATVNPPGGSYGDFARYLSGLLKEWGIGHRVIEIPHPTHPRFLIVGAYGSGEGGLHFHGHYDVVAPQSPTQFEPVVRDRSLFGRGSSDMKGGIAVMLYALRAIKECGVEPARSITFSFVPDEETGGPMGVRHLVRSGLLPTERMGMLMAEPTNGAVWHACRGALTLRVTVRGKSAHIGLLSQGVNAFEQMVEVVTSLLPLRSEVETRRTALPVTPAEAARSVMLIGGESAGCANANMVPEIAGFTIDRRLNPEESLAQARTELNEVFERHRRGGMEIDVEVIQEGEPSVAPPEAPLGRILTEAIGEVTGRPASFELCPGILETRFFTERGMPGYGYGPGMLAVSHGPEEHVRIQSLYDCTRVYALVAARLQTARGSVCQ